ncbi:MAG: hypothetical protein ACTS6H_01485 [Candidatus Hodgkinia cicadicola]
MTFVGDCILGDEGSDRMKGCKHQASRTMNDGTDFKRNLRTKWRTLRLRWAKSNLAS